jgi:membrane dipeptidase
VNRRHFLKKTALLGSATMTLPWIGDSRFQLFAGSPAEYSGRAIDLVGQSNVIDMLGLLTLDFPKLYHWQCDPETFRKADFELFKASGITVFHPAVCYDGEGAYGESREDAVRWNYLIAKQPDYFIRIDGPHDLDRAKASGKIGILLGEQNSEHFRTVEDVDHFYGLGQRLSLLAYDTNRIGGGSNDAHDPGLSAFGGRIVERMNHVGMAVDVAHCGDRTTLDAFVASSKPVLITHSNCRALVPNRSRCKSDETIRKMAATGGVIGISMIRGFLCASGPATIETVLDHIDHVARLVGVEHAGIGSDVDLAGRSCLPPSVLRAEHILPGRSTDLDGLNYPKKIFDLTEGLIRRGYSDHDIGLILGGNFRRALSVIWS